MSFGNRRKVGSGWQNFYAKIIFENQKTTRELSKRVAVLESQARPLEQVAWIETASGTRRVIVSMVSPDERVSLGMKVLFG